MFFRKIFSNSVVRFLASFVSWFLFLIGLNHLFIGLSVKGGIYNEWISANMDYVSAFRLFILKAASFFVKIFGFESEVSSYTLRLSNVSTVKMVYSCIGFDILSFWTAFTFAYPQAWKRKFLFMVLGVLTITFLNVIRVGGLAMIRSIHSIRSLDIDHHLIFNIVVYSVVFIMIHFMIKISNNIRHTNDL